MPPLLLPSQLCQHSLLSCANYRTKSSPAAYLIHFWVRIIVLGHLDRPNNHSKPHILRGNWTRPPAGGSCKATEKNMIVGPTPLFTRKPRTRLLRTGLALICGIWLSVFMSASSAGEEKHTSGTSSKSLRKQTVNSLPLGELTPETRDKINFVVQRPSVYRRLPVTSISADADHFQFLVRHPEVVVNIWQLMGVTQMQTERTGPYTINSNDGAGTISTIELIYGTENLHIFYGTGTYEGPILKRKLNGSCVLVLRSENQTGRDGIATQTSQLDVFLKIENATAGLIAKTIQPLVGTTADHNFVESLKFIQRLNKTTQRNGPGVERMSHRLDVDPAVREKYAEVIDKVFQRAINASAPTGPASIRPTSLRTQNSSVQPPAPTLGTSKFSNPVYPRQAGPPSFQSSPQLQNNYSNNVDPASSGYQRNPLPRAQVPSVKLGDSLPAHGYLAPTYSPTPAGFSYGYPASPTGQVRQQAYSDFNSEYGRTYGASHAYRQFSDSHQRPVQATYDHYGNYPQPTTR